MIPLLLVGLGGGVLAVKLLDWRPRPSLLDRLVPPGQSSEAAGQDAEDLVSSLRAGLDHLDDRYQALIQTRLDPLLAGQLRDSQMRLLTPGSLRELNANEKRTNRSLALGASGLVLIIIGRITLLPLTPAVIAIGIYNIWPGIQECGQITFQERRFSIMHVLLIYVGGLWLGGNVLVGTIGLLFGGLCEKFEHLTQTVTRHSLTHLLGMQPLRVWVLRAGKEQEIPFEQLVLGDILLLSAGQAVPVDGMVVEGSATVDQHRLTGESQPVEKLVGDAVLAATLVLGGKIQVRVEKTGAETAAARIGEVLNQTVEQQEIRLSDQFKPVEKYRWPMLAGGALGWFLRGPETGLAMLGCNFMLSQIPLRLLTLLNGLGTGAERGVLIKDGRALERLPAVDTVVFDKTGTLTMDRQRVAAVEALFPFNETEVLTLAAAAEQRQSHPIAEAILAEAALRQLALPDLEVAHVELGLGLTAQIAGQLVRIGSERFLAQEQLELPAELVELQTAAHARGHGLVFVTVAEAVAGAIELEAVSRPEALATVQWLKLRGISTYILSGDQEAPTANLAKELGMDGWFANTLPEQKANRIQALQQQGKRVCFIGDGINDAIALRQAEVSISLRGATTVATDAAQVVLMEDDLSQLRLLWELAEGFEESLGTNARQAGGMSLLAATGVLLLPFGYWTVILMASTSILVGIHTARQPLLHPGAEQVGEGDLEPLAVG